MKNVKNNFIILKINQVGRQVCVCVCNCLKYCVNNVA